MCCEGEGVVSALRVEVTGEVWIQLESGEGGSESVVKVKVW